MALVWRETMSIGVPSIDADHKRLLGLINTVEQGIAACDLGVLGEVFDRAKLYAEAHFAHEEAMMAAVAYPDREAHAANHREARRKALIVYNKFHEFKDTTKKTMCATLLFNLLTDYFTNHVMTEDLKLKPYLASSVIQGQSWSSAKRDPVPAERRTRSRDVEYVLPEALAHLIRRPAYVIPPLPPPQQGFDDFNALCAAALRQRIDHVLVFFQRHNPDITRELPPIFCCSPAFAEKFHAVVRDVITPVIRQSRQVQMLSTSFNTSAIDSENFWTGISPVLKKSILSTWATAWDALKLIDTVKADGTRVQRVLPKTRQMRDSLQPDHPDDYILPRIGNREIATFSSFLDTDTDWWVRLNKAWTICNDVYEQEKDPRVFQQKARDGALRDNLLAAFADLPEQWGDLIVLTCYRVFPRVDIPFLESFATNFGRTEDARAAYVPYTIHYLKQARLRPEIRAREVNEELAWKAQAKRLSDFLSGRSGGDGTPA